jgi:glutaminase
MQVLLDDLHRKYRPFAAGEVASYIPELAKANPDDFGISVATEDGRVHDAGDANRAFTIQSISKPFTFGIAVEELGAGKVSQHVGVEPSGEPFNSIELQSHTNRPFNPMINTGAITVTALLHARHGEGTFEHILSRFSAMAGRRLSFDQAVYESERRTGHRNRGIAHLLLNFGMVHGEAEAALDVYFRQCAILVTCRDPAVMAANLSNLGRNPPPLHSRRLMHWRLRACPPARCSRWLPSPRRLRPVPSPSRPERRVLRVWIRTRHLPRGGGPSQPSRHPGLPPIR